MALGSKVEENVDGAVKITLVNGKTDKIGNYNCQLIYKK